VGIGAEERFKTLVEALESNNFMQAGKAGQVNEIVHLLKDIDEEIVSEVIGTKDGATDPFNTKTQFLEGGE
jgi:hypothetical protein